MRSLGLSRFKLFTPFLVVGMLIAGIAFSLNYSVIPYSQREFRRIFSLIASKNFLNDVKKNQFYTDIPNTTIFAENVEEEGKILSNVFIHLHNKEENEDKVIFAQKGFLIKSEAGDLSSDQFLRMKLTHGNIIQNYKTDKNMEKIIFDEYDFPIFSQQDTQGSFIPKHSMRSSRDLFHSYQNLKRDVKTNPELLTDENKSELVKMQVELWSRINTPLVCLVFILLGFSLGIQRARGKNQNSALICFVVLIFYYALYFTGLGLAKNEKFPTWIAVFGPTLVTFLYAFKRFSKLEWAS